MLQNIPRSGTRAGVLLCPQIISGKIFMKTWSVVFTWSC